MNTIKEIKEELYRKEMLRKATKESIEYHDFIRYKTHDRKELVYNLEFTQKILDRNLTLNVKYNDHTKSIIPILENEIIKLKNQIQKLDDEVKSMNETYKPNKELCDEMKKLRVRLREMNIETERIEDEAKNQCKEVSPKDATVEFYKDTTKSLYNIECKIIVKVVNNDYLTSRKIFDEIFHIVEHANKRIRLLTGE